LRYFFLIFSLFFILGMAQAPRPQTSPQAQASITKSVIKQALRNLKSAYESRNTLILAASLDKDFEASLEFRADLEEHFRNVKDLEITFIPDSFLIDKDKVDIRLHWFKKTIDNAGTFSKTQGSSQFFFTKGPEGLKLLYFRGDNPFF